MSPFDSSQCAAVRAELDRLLATPTLAASLRRGQLLRYLVERTLAGSADAINEYAIGLDVFEKPQSFDPRIESIVRTEAGRLRQKLRDHYADPRNPDRVVIEIPLRSYKPTFVFREIEVDHGVALAPPNDSVVTRRRPRILAAAALGLAILGLAIGAWLWQTRSKRPIRSLVVLPFLNLSPNGADEYLSDGLTDELTNDFANWKDVRVVARTSAYQYKGRGVDIRRIGRELEVDGVLEGSLSRQGDHIRVTAQLCRTSDGYHIWSRSYDSRSLDMLNVQQDIAQAIAREVRKLDGRAGTPAKHASTTNPEALDLYLQASYEYTKLTPASLHKSLSLYEEAIRKDPAYARAYVGLAMAEMELTNFGERVGASRRERDALAEAIKLDPDAGDAHWLLGQILVGQDWDWPSAEREFQLALEKGAQPAARASYGWALAFHGRFAEAQAQCTAAEYLEPAGIAPRFCQFYIYYVQKQFPQARKVLLDTLSQHPDLIYAHQMLGIIALVQRDCDEVARQYRWVAAKLPSPADTLAAAYESACRGDSGPARRSLTLAAQSVPPPRFFELAFGYAALGDKETTISLLQQAAKVRESLPHIIINPLFDGLRQDPRYQALERLGGF